AGRAVAVAAEVGRLDPRQVGLERDPAVVLAAVKERAREHDRRRGRRRAVRPRPAPGLVGRAVEIGIGPDTAPDRNEQRLTRPEAGGLVAVRAVRVVRVPTAAILPGHLVAVLEMPDLIREGDVV